VGRERRWADRRLLVKRYAWALGKIRINGEAGVEKLWAVTTA
jgi:hypothetical protein